MKKYFQQTQSLAFSLLAILPLILTYEYLIVYYNKVDRFEIRNAAEKFLKDLLGHAGITLSWQIGTFYLLLTLLVIVYGKLYKNLILPKVSYWGIFLFESLFYATFFGLGTRYLTKLVLSLQATNFYDSLDLMHKSLLAIAAGVYEEFLFRLIILGSLLFLFKRLWPAKLWIHAIVASSISAAVFAIFHYPSLAFVTWDSFIFRLIAGWILGMLFVFRGLAIAVYTHAFYDILYIFKAL